MMLFARRRLLACLGVAAAGVALHPARALANRARRDVVCRMPTMRLNGDGFYAEFAARIGNEGDSVMARGTLTIPVAFPTEDTPDTAAAIREAETRVVLRVRLAFSSAVPEVRVDRYELALDVSRYMYGVDVRPINSLLVGDNHVPPTFIPDETTPVISAAWSAFLNGEQATVWAEDADRRIAPELSDGRREPYAFLYAQNRVMIEDAMRIVFPGFVEMIERHAVLAQSDGPSAPGTDLGQNCEIPSAGAPCFFTTATTGAVGLPDTCFELQALRRFRDTVLTRTATGRALIAEYYLIAPALVSAIDARPDARRVWLGLYRAYVLPVAVLARLGLSRLALAHYTRLVRRIQALAAS